MKEMQVFYFHIPKTGGQTLATRLASAFPPGKSDIIGGGLRLPNGVAELRKLLETNQFVERHVFGPVLKDFPGLDMIITIREPVTHIVSDYLHVLRDPKNHLHRAAKKLTAQDFFSRFGDLLANRQSLLLMVAFALFKSDVVKNLLRQSAARMFDGLDLIKWVVPTESIDEFTMLWSLENQRLIPREKINVNIALRDDNYQKLIDLVRGLSDFYSLDALLWQAARERFAEYRERVLRMQLPFNAPDNPSRAYFEEGEGIWLNRGWHPPRPAPAGPAWWAGPERHSEVIYRRKNGHRYLKFSVIALCGVPHDTIFAAGPDKETVLSVVRRKEDSHWVFEVDLGELPEEGSLWLYVWEVKAGILVHHLNEDMTRMSFATCGWGFE